MRRRPRGLSQVATAVEAATIYAEVKADAAELPQDRRARYVRDALALHGLDPVQAVRAVYWLRKGRKGDGWRTF